MQRALFSSLKVATVRSQLVRFMASSQKASSSASAISKDSEEPEATQTTVSPGWTLREENKARYRAGGYYLTQVGDDYLGGRYTIAGKLGWGEYSTVWLARDNQAGIDVALKIMTDEGTNAPELHELEFHHHLRRQDPNHAGYPYIVHPTDSFYVDGPHGRHLCFVTEVALCNVLSLAEESFIGSRIPEFGAKRIIRDVLSALDYVHNVCNIIHTDVKVTNVVMTVPQEEIPPEGLGAFIPSLVHTFPPSAENKTPLTITKSTPIVPDLIDPEEWPLLTFKLIDFGVACYADKTDEHFTQAVCPIGIRPPEVAMGIAWGKPVDIWSAGCMVYGMLVGKSLFPNRCDTVLLPLYHAQALGKFPASLRNRSRLSKVWFNEDGFPRYKEAFPMKSLEIMVEEQTGGALTLSPDSVDFIRRMLTLEPEERASIEELLKHRWLN